MKDDHQGTTGANPTLSLVDEMVAILAYAEVRAVLLGWAGVRTWHPALRARSIVARVAPGSPAGEVIERAQGLLREESRALLEPVIRRAGPWPFDATIGPGQIGSSAGLEAIFHTAGKVAVVHRGHDPRLLSLAVSLADFVRNSRGDLPTP